MFAMLSTVRLRAHAHNLHVSPSLPSNNPVFRRLVEEVEASAGGPITLTQLAKYLGESPQTVQNWRERGVSQRGIANTSARFGLDIGYITTGKRCTRQSLSGEALAIAAAFDGLPEWRKVAVRSVLAAIIKEPVSDADVERAMPITAQPKIWAVHEHKGAASDYGAANTSKTGG